MRQLSDCNPAIVADVWGSLSSGSVATGTTVRPLGDFDLLGAGVMSSRTGAPAGTGGLLWSRAVQMFKSGRGVTVRVDIAEDDTATVRHVAATLTRLLLYCDALEIARPDGDLPNLKLTGIGYGDMLLVDAGRYIDAAHVGAVTHGPAADAAAEPTAGPAPAPMAEHARLARELRNRTGLPAATLGAALGVTREQYQRWLRGDPISTIRHGLLSYLHTIAADAARRLGPDRAHVWWRTPASDGIAPDQRLRDRLTDDVHRLVTALPDPAPIIDDVLVALPAQQPLNLGDYDDLDDEDDPADDWKSEAAAVHDEHEYSDDSSSPGRGEDHTQA